MPSPPQSPLVDLVPHAAVSDLKSRFEKLAHETSSPPRQAGGKSLLSPQPPPRSASDSDDQDAPGASNGSLLRSSSSSSDLKSGGKRPPPPPPPSRGGAKRATPSPSGSPLIRPVPMPPSSTSMPNVLLSSPGSGKSALLSRKPPPPPAPAPSVQGEYDLTLPSPSTSVASLRDRFGVAPIILAPKPVVGHSRVPSGSILTSSNTLHSGDTVQSPVDSPRISHLSISTAAHTASAPDIKLHSPFSDGHSSDSDKSAASYKPPLPSRKRTSDANGNGHKKTASSGSSDSHTSVPSSRPGVPLPPRPPPRHQASLAPSFGSESSSSTSSTPITQNRPPLPRRRPTTPVDDSHPPPPPRLPARHPSISEADPYVGPPSAPPAPERRLAKLPPPPTRTIGLGDRLPPARRPPSPSSDESEDEDVKSKILDTMPDTSRSSRRPPIISHYQSEARVTVPSHSGLVAVSGHTVVEAHTHHVRIYDLSYSETPRWDVDLKDLLKDWKVKEWKVTSSEFRGGCAEADKGCLLWVGTKDGHLLEFDVRSGVLMDAKPAAHTHGITHIFRHGSSMITLDDSGKVLVFTDSEGDLRLGFTQPRVVRIADKQDFAKMLGGKLWTSARMETGGSGSVSRGPIVRVYDILVPGSTGKSMLPTEHVGNVTSGTILPSEPNHVYLGHEGGFISIWALGNVDTPACLEVMKVSTSDVLCLEGVGEKLWAGGRKGMIAAYDVVPRPWIMTNNWMAHSGLPATKLFVDPFSIEKMGKLCVVSVGRDEKVRFWDGCLSANWIDAELLKQEDNFSSLRELNVLMISWNVDAAKPDALNGVPENVNFLDDALRTVDSPDIIVFGFQELIDLENRKMAAKTVLLGGKKKAPDGSISEKVTTSYKKWYDRLVLAVRLAMPPDVPYTVIHAENLVGLFSCIFVKNTERIALKDVAITTVKRGMGGRYGNKGGIVARFVIDDSSICFINCHLAAGQHHVRQRNADVAAILEDKEVFPAVDSTIHEPLAYVGGGDGSMVLDHEIVFFSGDMNYRIEQRREAVAAAVKANDFDYLIAHDQLCKEMKHNRGFRLRSFTEGPLIFAPTYKYDRRSNEYDTSEKRRVPAWCDRILWRSRDERRVTQLHYQRYEANISDHRPISAGFRMTVKSVNKHVRGRTKEEVESLWMIQEYQLLSDAREYYKTQALV
ncbi:hypothetical protein JAAARDRAFT_39767 [Jaapia argillacea MUCL 33604]|uniref:Inositol polyphosphate-related phosphatase domain-containing protein n=1 Tax=Jaapia argillacea MUCL 33604 TaxID=933084 RepID=A0A067PGV1_9AGAM|nr:hypothetical protein JAAARDRAFT_39767 [Jaapia argillacea MUCL 33604]